MKQSQILDLIKKERERQDKKWGIQNHNIFKWLAILGEEVGEVNKSALENNRQEVISELVQIGAVTVAIIESLERNR